MMIGRTHQERTSIKVVFVCHERFSVLIMMFIQRTMIKGSTIRRKGFFRMMLVMRNLMIRRRCFLRRRWVSIRLRMMQNNMACLSQEYDPETAFPPISPKTDENTPYDPEDENLMEESVDSNDVKEIVEKQVIRVLYRPTPLIGDRMVALSCVVCMRLVITSVSRDRLRLRECSANWKRRKRSWHKSSNHSRRALHLYLWFVC